MQRNPKSAPRQARDGMSDQIVSDYVKTFNTPSGRRVLDHLEQRAYSAFRLDQLPTDTKPNPAYMDRNAALYRSAQIDVVQKIRRTLKKAGIEIQALEDQPEIKNIQEEG